MFENESVVFRGVNYTLELMSHSAGSHSAKRMWYGDDGMAAPSRITQDLNREFIQQWTQQAISAMTSEEQSHLSELLSELGVGMERLKELGLAPRTPDEIIEILREERFSELPDPGHSPANCADILKWAMEGKTCQIHSGFCFVGDGPFPQDELRHIGTSSEVFCYATGEQFGQALVSYVAQTNRVPILICHVIGRENWDEDEIDELINSKEGSLLKFYSQEMFASYLLTGKDPFDCGLDLLTAFRIGHPALEYLSQGWPGWVSSIVTPDRGRRGDRWYPDISRQTGLLKYMGYTVGANGLPDTERRRILEEVFSLDLSQLESVSDESYLREWGDPQTGLRLHKMAESIAAFCRNMRSRSNPSQQAIVDWEHDLHWLRTTYYTGVMRFAWPQTIVG